MINQNQVDSSLKSPAAKRELNKDMFTIISNKYDFITRALSFGCDRDWKKAMVQQLPDLQTPFCLDLACGTGDLCTLLAERYPQGTIMGVDITPAMLALAHEHNVSDQVTFIQADMASPPVDNNSVDIITGGYALRNAPDLDVLLTAVWDKLKPGGTASFLDFSKSDNTLIQTLQLQLLTVWTGLFGLILHANPVIYSYIASSLKTFPTGKQLQSKIEQRGFIGYQCTYHHQGFIAKLSFTKPL